MSKQSATVLEFIAAGRTGNSATSVEFEGFATRGDEGNGLRFFKTGTQATASQTPIQRGDNSFTDVNGWVYQLNSGSVIYYNGSNNWFPNLGSAGVGTYTSSPTNWNIASVSPTNSHVEWDFELVANDGIELRSGYGTRNAHGNKAADFSRASGTGSINKSGVVDTLAVDEASIVKDGLEAYEVVTNEVRWSEDFLNSAWSQGDGIVVAGTTAPDLSSNAFTVTAVSTSIAIGQPNGGFSVGDVLTGSMWIRRKSGVGTVRMTVGDIGGIITEQPTNEWKRISVTGGPITDSTARLYLQMGAIGDELEVWGAQLTKTTKSFPYVKTESTPSTRSPDICSVPAMGNIPPIGQSYTIEVDCSIPIIDGVVNHAFRIQNSILSQYFYIRGDGSGGISFNVDGFPTVTHANDGAHHRFCITVSATERHVYIDGDLKYTDTGVLDMDVVNSDIWIGHSGGAFHLNSTIKALRIAHKALTADQIAARGGYPYD